jgi:carbon monoxide dehydrogenase subunit G
MLKKILTALGVIVVLLLVIPAVLSSKIRINRSIEIQSSPAAVHAFLADLNQYPKWNPFSENDPGSTAHVTGTGVGSVLTWKGDKTGEGKMTITEIQPSQSVKLKLEFYTPMAGEALVAWKTETIDANKTRMTWSMDEDLPYLQRYFGLMMDGALGRAFERGLGNLKKQIEKS